MANIRDPYNEFPEQQTQTQTPYREIQDRPQSGSLWGWVAGGVVIALLILVFAFGTNSGDKTASNPASPTTTTQTAPPANPGQARTPVSPSENTGRTPSAPASPATSAPAQ